MNKSQTHLLWFTMFILVPAPFSQAIKLKYVAPQNPFIMHLCTCHLRYSLSYFLLFLCLIAEGQASAGNNLKESIHLHTDKETYLPGDTLWFKAYLKAGNFTESLSTNLFTKIVDGEGNILSSALWPIFDATSKGSFVLPQTIPSTGILISAYTYNMVNGQNKTALAREIQIVNVDRKDINNSTPAGVLFFPEGGSLVPEISNHIVFKCEAGTEKIEKVFTLKNLKGEVIDTFQIPPAGLGHFKLIPSVGESYYAEWKTAAGSIRQTPLPTPSKGKVALHVEELKDQLFYMVEKPENLDAEEMFVTASLDGDTVYRARLNLSSVSVMAGKIPVAGLPGGFMMIKINDKRQDLLAERLYYLNPSQIAAKANVEFIKRDLLPGGLNTIEISIPDTLLTNASLAVFDANFEAASDQPSIFTDLLFQGIPIKEIPASLSGYSITDPINRKQLDFFIQSTPIPAIEENAPGIIPESPDDYLMIEGEFLDQKNKPLANEEIMMIIQLADSSKIWKNIKTDKNGRFTQGGLVFNDSALVFFRIKNAGIDPEKIKLNLLAANNPQVKFQNLYLAPAQQHRLNPAMEIYKASKIKTVELDNVTVTGIKQEGDAMSRLDKKYTSGYFAGGATAFAIDVAGDKSASNKFDIYNYLAGKIPQLRIKYTSSSAGTLKRFDGNYVYFINESQVEPSAVDQLNLNNIGYVKYFRRFGAIPGMPEAICIYLKKDNDWKTEPGELLKQKVGGYNSEYLFSAPDYSAQQVTSDYRTTLLWEPSIILNKDQPKTTISFYNNSICKKMKVVLEGMNENGQLIRVEKLIN